MADMPCCIVVQTPAMRLVVGPFDEMEDADQWIARKRENPNGYLGVEQGRDFSFEVVPLQSPDLKKFL